MVAGALIHATVSAFVVIAVVCIVVFLVWLSALVSVLKRPDRYEIGIPVSLPS